MALEDADASLDERDRDAVDTGDGGRSFLSAGNPFPFKLGRDRSSTEWAYDGGGLPKLGLSPFATWYILLGGVAGARLLTEPLDGKWSS